MPSSRLYFIDNLRILLSSLVVVFHLAITYGGPGNWFYVENQLEGLAGIPLTLFVVTNQSFFMGLFFFIAAYFIAPSIQKKGAKGYLFGRLGRLGIPLLLFFFLFRPLTDYFVLRLEDGNLPFFPFLLSGQSQGFGPMWFAELLILFTLIFLVLYQYTPLKSLLSNIKAPRGRTLFFMAFAIGILTFFLRIWSPVTHWLPFFHLQPAHLTQYLALFILGIIAQQNKWLDQISLTQSKRYFWWAQGFIFIIFPFFYLLGKAEASYFIGGWHWQSLFYSLWEQITAVLLIVALLGVFKTYWNHQKKWQKQLANSSFAVYFIHPLVLVIVSTFLHDLSWHPLVKFITLSPIVLFLCFGTGYLLKQLPLLRRIF